MVAAGLDRSLGKRRDSSRCHLRRWHRSSVNPTSCPEFRIVSKFSYPLASGNRDQRVIGRRHSDVFRIKGCRHRYELEQELHVGGELLLDIDRERRNVMADHGRPAHWLMESHWTGNWSHRVRIARRGLHRTARASWPPIHVRRRAHVEKRRIRWRDDLADAVSWSRHRQR